VEYNKKSLPKNDCPENTVMKPHNQSKYSELFVKCVSNESNTEDSSSIWISTHEMTDAVWQYIANVTVGELDYMRSFTFYVVGGLKKLTPRMLLRLLTQG
jgi:hypothetical protein